MKTKDKLYLTFIILAEMSTYANSAITMNWRKKYIHKSNIFWIFNSELNKITLFY